MELLANDLSLHGQFADLSSFCESIGRLMRIRVCAKRFGRALFCHRNLAIAQVTPELTIQGAASKLSTNQRRALLSWLNQQGPFWEDSRLHGSDQYMEHQGSVVTDTAVGETAFCCLNGVDRRLVSLDPSSWLFSPVPVRWTGNDDDVCDVAILNYWDPTAVEAALENAPAASTSWAELATAARLRFDQVVFAGDAFSPLDGHPFVAGAATRLLVLLDVLNRLRACYDQQGKRTPEGQRLYQEHFTGDKAWFSDSSDTEKDRFRKDLTFAHPLRRGDSIFCCWHGKVKTPQLRIHFTWPVSADEPLIVAYVGPKITKT